MKTKEELNAIKEEVETLNKKLAELTDEELTQVSGGQGFPTLITRSRINKFGGLFADFGSLISDVRNRTELYDEFYNKMSYIADTILLEDPDSKFIVQFAVYKDGNDISFPYVYFSGTLSVIRVM